MITIRDIESHIYSKPATLLIDSGREEKLGKDFIPGHSYYGIQQSLIKDNAWFAGVFFEKGLPTMLYFFHNPDTIGQLYKENKNIQPGEAPLKTRSKLFIEANTNAALVYSLIDESYAIVKSKMTKAVQAEIDAIANEPNVYPFLKQIADELGAEVGWDTRTGSVQAGTPYFKYFDKNKSQQHYIGRFYHNQLLIGPYGYEKEAIGAERKEEWKAIILAKKEQLVSA